MIFTGLARQIYCSKTCQRKAYDQRQRPVTSLNNLKKGLLALRSEQAKSLPIFNRPSAPTTDPAGPKKSGHGVLIPISNHLEDRLARLLQYKTYDIDQALGGLIKLHGADRQLLSPNGEEMPASRREIMLHDLTLWGLNAALDLLRGKPARIKHKKRPYSHLIAKHKSVPIPAKPNQSGGDGNGTSTQDD